MYKSVRKNNATDCIVKLCCAISFVFQLLCDLISFSFDYAANFALFLNVYILFAVIIAYFFVNGINKHFLAFSFFVCFFIFLLGQKFFVVLQGGSYDRFLTFSALTLRVKEYFSFVNLLYFSLLSCFAGYVLFKPRFCKERKTGSAKKNELKNMRKLLRVLYVITFVCAFVMQWTIFKAKKDLSYTDSYLVNVDVNTVIKIGNYLFTGIAFLYLASAPKKKEMLWILFSFLFVKGFIQLFTGRRALLAQVLLFIVWYFVCYFKYDKKKFTLKHFALLFVFALLLIVLFYAVEALRGGHGVGGVSLLKMIEKFFTFTGGSDSTIANIIRHKSEFPRRGVVYLFNPLYEALFDNVLTRKIIAVITGTDAGSVAQGLEYLNRHDSFSHWLSYIVNPELYLNGYGMGSSYISEVYFAFGTVGFVIFGLILGACIRRCNNLRYVNGVYAKAFVMLFVYNVFVLPRGGVFSAATELLYLLAAMVLVKILCFIIYPAKHYSYGGKYERVP